VEITSASFGRGSPNVVWDRVLLEGVAMLEGRRVMSFLLVSAE
jgi:hypothetical protein